MANGTLKITSGLLIVSLLLAPMHALADKPAGKQALPAKALQKLSDAAEQENIEKLEDPDWLLIFLGNSLMATGTALFVIPLVKSLTTDIIPGLIRARRISKVEKAGEQTVDDLVAVKDRLDELGAGYRAEANRLNDHLVNATPPKAKNLAPQEVDELFSANRLYEKYASEPKLRAWLEAYTELWLSDASQAEKKKHIDSYEGPYQAEISKLSALQMDTLIERNDTFDAIARHADGPKWLATYQRLRANEVEASNQLVKEFQSAMGKVEEFTKSVSKLSNGFLAWAALRTKVSRYRLEPTPYAGAGKMRIAMNGGYFADVTEPRNMRAHLHGPFTDCQNVLVLLGKARVENLNKLHIGFGLPLVVGGGLAGLGWGLNKIGHHNIEKRYHARPSEIVANAKKEEAQASARDASRGQELRTAAQGLAELRAKDPQLAAAYATLRSTVREKAYLQSIADGLRPRLTAQQRTDIDLDERLHLFLNDESAANRILDYALADAASKEAKISRPEGIREALFANDVGGKAVRSRMQLATFESLPKLVWPNLGAHSYNVNDGKLSEMVKYSSDRLDKVSPTPLAVMPKEPGTKPPLSPTKE